MERGEVNKQERVRAMLTPEVEVCGQCQDRYRELATCSACGQNMLSPGYSGMVYECPLCGELYCQSCWDTMESRHRSPE